MFCVVVFRRELFDRIVLIYNPANPRIPRSLAEGVRDDLCRRLPDSPVTLQPTRYAGHAHELAAAAAATGRPLIVAVSGDGVYNEVVNGIMDVDGSSALSVVAAGGNANDHRRSTRRMPLVAAIVDGRARYLDLLRLTVRSSDVLWSRYAHSYIGFGLTPLMAISLKKDCARLSRALTLWIARPALRANSSAMSLWSSKALLSRDHHMRVGHIRVGAWSLRGSEGTMRSDRQARRLLQTGRPSHRPSWSRSSTRLYCCSHPSAASDWTT